jgi:hypothetical protein
MTYSSQQLIEAADYNGFVSTNAQNMNGLLGTGSSDRGLGQTTLSTVAAEELVTATQWATLVNSVDNLAAHQGTTITARSAPVTGNTIEILANLGTDITSLDTNRGWANVVGTTINTFSGTTSKTTDTGSGTSAWTITFTHTITFASANAARYFFNAGGRIKWETSKTSTGQQADTEWNDLANTLVGDIYITGGVTTQNIVGTNYTGTTKVGGTGTPNVLLTGTGWYDLTTSDTLIYRQYADTAPYTGQYIAINAKTAASGTQLVLTTTWVDPGGGTFNTSVITGGTATSSPFTTFGTAPATVVTVIPAGTTYITNTWGTPSIAASVA